MVGCFSPKGLVHLRLVVNIQDPVVNDQQVGKQLVIFTVWLVTSLVVFFVGYCHAMKPFFRKIAKSWLLFKGFLRIPFKFMKTKMCCFHEDVPEMFIKSTKKRGPADVQLTFAKRLVWCVRGCHCACCWFS